MADNNVVKPRDAQAQKAAKTSWLKSPDRFWKQDTKFMRGLKTAGGAATKGLEHVPLTPQRGRMKRREQAEMTGKAVADGIAAGNKDLIAALRGDQDEVQAESTPKGEKAAGGAYGVEFLAELKDAIRRGQSRTGDTYSMIIREVVTQPMFVQAVAARTVDTPLEQIDSEYLSRMDDIRTSLAQELATGSIRELNADKLDIIISTMVGSKYQVDAAGKYVFQRDDKGNIVANADGEPQRAEVWTREKFKDDKGNVYGWPDDLPTPPEAFLRFVESIAQRKYPGQEGEFIGTVLKDFSERRTTCPETTDDTLRFLLDGDYVDGYLEARSAGPIDSAVHNFSDLLVEILLTPTNKMHEDLKVPGTGYFKEVEGFGPCRAGLADGVAAKMDELENAAADAAAAEANLKVHVQNVRDMKDGRDNVAANLEAAKAEVVAAKEKLNKVEQAKKAVEEGKLRLPKDRLDAEEKAAKKEIADAQAKVKKTESMLETAEEMLNEATANARKAKTIYDEKTANYKEKETHMNEVQKEELDRFERLVRDCTDHFRAKIVEAKEINEDLLDSLAGRVEKWLDNITISNLLKDVDDLLKEREKLAGVLVVEETTELPESVRETAGIAKQVMGSKIEEFEKKLIDFAGNEGEETDPAKIARGKVKEANLPPEIERKFLDIAKAMRNMKLGNMFIEQHQLSELRELRYPLRNAAKLAVESLNRRSVENLGEITQAQFIIARMIWESSPVELRPRTQKFEGKWRRFWNRVFWHVFTAESWIGKSKKDRPNGEERGGKLTGLYRWALKETVEDLFVHPGDRVVGRDPNSKKAHRYGWYRRFFRGVWKGALKLYLAWTFVAAFAASPARDDLSWYQKAYPWNWNFRHYINHYWRPPWEWYHAIDTPLSHRRIIDDSYDIPDRLAHRPDSYYTKAYGITGEERLDWLRDHPDVLRYFQERTTLRQVSKVWDLGVNTQKTCSQPARGVERATKQAKAGDSKAPAKAAPQAKAEDVTDEARNAAKQQEGEKQGREQQEEEEPTREEMSAREREMVRLMKQYGQTIPDTCRDLGITELEGVVTYQPLTKTPGGGRDYDPDPAERLDLWEPGYAFCCTVGLETRRIEDGLVLNVHDSDGFLDYLQVQERNGAKLDLPYFDANTREWTSRGYLISQQKRQVMRDFKIRELDRVEFIIAQGEERISKSLLQPIIVEARTDGGEKVLRRAESVVPEKREQFLQEWENQIKARDKTLDPRRDFVEDQALEEAFAATVAKGRKNGWVAEMTEQHAQQMLLKRFSDLQLTEEAAFTLLAPDNQRIRDYLAGFDNEGAQYRLNGRLLNDFIEELQMHQTAGGDVFDYNPFSMPMGRRAQWAINAGYVIEVDQYRGIGEQSREPEQQATERAEAQRFWQSQSEAQFGIMVQAVIDGLFEDEGRDGNTVRAAFEGNRERTESYIRSEIYRILTGDSGRATRIRGQWSVALVQPAQQEGDAAPSGQAEASQATVTVEDAGRASRGIRAHVIERLAKIQRAQD